MLCCLNPDCAQPLNADTAVTCRHCNSVLIPLLRGRYRPVKVLGRGGFGKTYLAQDCDRLNAFSVVKQFAPQSQGTKSFKKAVQLFQQEAERLHQLGEHPQIPTLQAYFEYDGFLYLVQQMIEGKTLLQDVRRNGTLDEEGLRSLLSEILPVLQFVHDQNVIHRDVTPNNIICRRLDGKPVLIDFGVAKQLSETLSQEPGTRIGTEGYAPMEQLRSGQAYPCSDIYSLGTTCLHLITGVRPEKLYNPLDGKWRWREELEKAGNQLDPLLADILDKMVMDLPGDRFPSAQAALEALQALPSRHGVVPGWIRQHPNGRISDSSPPSSPFASLISPGQLSSRPPSRPPSKPASQSSSRPPSKPLSQDPAAGAKPIASTPRAAQSRAKGWHCIRTLTGHQSWVTTVRFNPKTPTLASGSLDDTIRLWNLQTGLQLYKLPGHRRGVNEVEIGNGGQVLASCGDDDLVKVWNLSTAAQLHTLKGHMRDVNTVAISPSGLLLASGGEDRSIVLWKLDKGGLFKTLKGSAGIIKTLVFNPNEQLLISGGMDNKIRIWNLQKGEMVRALSGHLNSINRVALSRDGKLIASASKDRTIKLWSLGTGALIHTLSGHSQDVNGVAIAPDGKTVISGSRDGSVRLWNILSGELQHTLTGHTASVNSVAAHRSGRLIASASADKTIKIWQWFN
ncbi:MAG: serine/threonine-protein kinase [Cyanobacteria bacterium P01_H01_bin.119]